MKKFLQGEEKISGFSRRKKCGRNVTLKDWGEEFRAPKTL
jgi:hypothetical protein